MREDVINRLDCEVHAKQSWWRKKDCKKWATVCERAGYRCEYCGKDMLASLDDYYSMQADHIIPRNKKAQGCDTVENQALSCPVCNGLKGDWNPAEEGERDNSRYLIPAVRQHLIEKRVNKYKEFLESRLIVGYPFFHQQCSCCE